MLIVAVAFFRTDNAGALTCTSCVDGGDIKDGTLKSIDIYNSSITGIDIKSNSIGSTDLADSLAVDTLTANAIQVGSLFNTDFLNLGSAVVEDIADNGAGTAASFSLSSSVAWAFMGFNCGDADGCNVTLGEDFLDGDVMFIYNAGANTVNFADSSGVSELSGVFAMGQWDTLQLIFRDNGSTESWLEFGRSDN
jgi:hypothetical protein